VTLALGVPMFPSVTEAAVAIRAQGPSPLAPSLCGSSAGALMGRHKSPPFLTAAGAKIAASKELQRLASGDASGATGSYLPFPWRFARALLQET
jgi:hypothetical protein